MDYHCSPSNKKKKTPIQKEKEVETWTGFQEYWENGVGLWWEKMVDGGKRRGVETMDKMIFTIYWSSFGGPVKIIHPTY